MTPSGSGRVLSGITQHFSLENTYEGERVARALKLKREPDLAAGQEGHLEQAGLDFVVIGPRFSFGP